MVQGAVGLVEDYAKLQFGSMEQRQEVAQRAWEKTKQVAQAVQQQFANDWEQAKQNGKEAELIADWGTRGLLEVASMFVGLGELKAAATTPKAASAIAKVEKITAEAGKLTQVGDVVGETGKLSRKVGQVVQECPVVKSPTELKVEIKSSTNTPTKLKPGTPEHKVNRWERYKARGGDKSYEEWSRRYDANMHNATYGVQRERLYREAMGAVERGKIVKTAYTMRQIDIYRPADDYLGQLKTGPVSLRTEEILAITKDAWLVKEGYTVEYILEQGASQPFLKALQDAGIQYKIGPQIK